MSCFIYMSSYYLNKRDAKCIFFLFFAYLIFGMVLFLYLLILDLQPYLSKEENRPELFYEYRIDLVMFYGSILLLIIRCSCIMLILYCYVMIKRINKAVKSEKLISIVKEQDPEKSDFLFSIRSRSNNNTTITINQNITDNINSSPSKPCTNQYYKLILN